MSGIAKEVHLIVRSSIRADAVYTSQYAQRQNIITYTGYEITELSGEDRLSEVVIKNRETGEEKKLKLDGLFTEIGWIPNTSFVDGLLKLNEQKEIEIDINCRTSAPGIFAAGDVTAISGKQIIIACGEGAKAALSAFDYLMTR
jgi:alkyl hydroperoxide reductase subunit F